MKVVKKNIQILKMLNSQKLTIDEKIKFLVSKSRNVLTGINNEKRQRIKIYIFCDGSAIRVVDFKNLELATVCFGVYK